MKLLVLKQKLLNLTKDKRSYEIQKNIVLSFLFKGISIIVSLVIVPLTLNYLNPTEYGVWLTLSSIMTWINLFDIGLGNGLRNKLTEALTLGDIKKGQNLTLNYLNPTEYGVWLTLSSIMTWINKSDIVTGKQIGRAHV